MVAAPGKECISVANGTAEYIRKYNKGNMFIVICFFPPGFVYSAPQSKT